MEPARMRYRNIITNQEPIVFHAPGKARRSQLWGRLQVEAPDHCASVEHPGISSSHEYAVITWNTSAGESLLESCFNALQEPCHVLGRGKTDWTNRDKTRLAIEAIESMDADIIIGLDAWDVVLTRHPREIVNRFLHQDFKMLFNASTHPWPAEGLEPALDASLLHEYNAAGKYRHLNAGCWIGHRETVLDFLRAVDQVDAVLFTAPRQGNEQTRVRYAWAASERFKAEVGVDSKCSIFQHMRRPGDLRHVA